MKQLFIYLVALLLSIQVFALYSGGDGSSVNPYLLSTKQDLIDLSSAVNGGTTYSNKYFKLTNNISLSSTWIPIGTSGKPFSGIFDGNYYTVSGVTVLPDGDASGSSSDYKGFFGNATNCQIKNLTLDDISIRGRQYVGGIAGSFSGKITNCHVKSGDIKG